MRRGRVGVALGEPSAEIVRVERANVRRRAIEFPWGAHRARQALKLKRKFCF